MRGFVTIAVACALGASGAAAQDVLTGHAAFGDYRSDAPGVKRLIRAGDLEAPDRGGSSSNAPGNVDRPEGAMPLVPPGFAVELVASGIENPRAIRFAPNGNLFVANSAVGQVLVYPAGAGEGTVFAGGLDSPYGIAFYPRGAPEWVYVAVGSGLVRFPYDGGIAPSGAPEQLLDDIPSGGHWTRDIVFSADGATLFYSVGSASNAGSGMAAEPSEGVESWAAMQPLGAAWGNEAGRATVLAMDPDGDNRRVFATGLRNCAGMAWQSETDTPWCVVNERDALGDNVPFDYATSVRDSSFYGWPWFYIGANPDPRWQLAPRDDLKGSVTVPDVLFQAHSAPLNIAFYTSDAWGPEFSGDAFVTMHGSWNRGSRTGYKVVKLDFDGNGKPTGGYEDFMTGFVVDDAKVWGRPVGVAAAPDGSLYVSDDGSGSLWRVSRVD